MEFPQPGDAAPEFEATTENDERVKLSDYRGQQVVLYFYPKADTPGCTMQACNFRDNYGAFQQRGVVVLGASPDTVEEQRAFKEKYNLPFTLLADADHSIAEAYGLWGEHEVDYKGRKFSYTGLLRSTLIIDPEGRVQHAALGVDPANNTADVLALLDELTPSEPQP